MTHKGQGGKILHLADAKKKKDTKKPLVNSALQIQVLALKSASSQEHLLPIQFPYAQCSESTRLVNIPWSELGSHYIRAICAHFPKGYLLDNDRVSCRVERIDFTGIDDEADDIPYEFTIRQKGTSFRLLEVPITRKGERCIEKVANIIADPLGLEVFMSIVEKYPERCFHTQALDTLPISHILIDEIEELNFSI